MSKETKNPLIESFLKLNERSTPIRPKGPMPISGERVNASGTGYDATEFSTQKSMADLTKTGSNFATLGVDRYKQSAAPPVASATPSTSAFKANMGQPSQGTTAGSAYQPRTYDQKVSDVQNTYSINPVGTKTSNLRVGSSGDQVSYVQKQLGITADKQYGDDTKKAVMDFQKRHNLKVDGIVGDQTLSALKRAEAMGKLQMADKAGSAAKETQKFAGPPSGSAAPIKTAPTNFSGGRTGFKGNAGNIKTASSSNLVGPGASKPLYSVSDKPYDLSGQVNKPDLISTGLAGKTLPGNDANERSIYVQKRLRNLASARSSGSFLTQGDNTEMSNKLIEAFMKLQSLNTSNIFEAAKKAKKLDPVGKEDEDIDNDGDKDKTDSYLHNRRKKIAAAMKEAKDPNAENDGGVYTTPPRPMTDEEKPKKKLPSEVVKTGPQSSTAYKQKEVAEEVEYIDEAAGGLPAEHKKAITNHVKKMWGKGTVTFDKQDGKHFVTHNDGIESQVHSIHMKGGKAHVTHFMTVQEEVEQIDEIFNSPSKELGYALKNIGSKLKAGLTGDKNTVRKRERGEKSFKKNAAKKKDEREMDSYRNKLAGKALRDMGRKTGLGMYYDKIHKEEVEQINELKKSALQAVRNRASGRMMDDPRDEKAANVERQASKRLKKIDDEEKEESSKRAYKAYKEEVEFSEAELAHFAAILEGPVAPTLDDYSPKAFGSTASRSGTLTDEAIAEEEAKRGRGRPKGSKSGSKHGEGGNASGVTHLVDQIKHARTRGIADGKGNYMLKHEHGTNKDGSPKVHTAAVSQKASNEFYSAYHGAEKPAAKQDLHDKFVAKHFNISKPKATGITLPKMPSAKS